MSPTFFNISILNSGKIMEDLCGDRTPCHPHLTLLPHTLPLLLRMESTGGNSIRAHFLAVAGISEAEIRRTHQVLGPLDELPEKDLHLPIQGSSKKSRTSLYLGNNDTLRNIMIPRFS